MPTELWLADLASGASWPLTTDLVLREQLAWSPDGTRLALIEQGQLAIYDAQSGARKMVAPAVATVNGSYVGYAWLPDGSGLVYLSTDASDRQWIEVTTGQYRPVAVPLVNGARAIAVATTPGQQAATLLLAQGALLEIALEGGPPTLLSTGAEAITAFAWSNDGARLAYAAPDGLLWWAVRGASGLEASQPLAAFTAPITRLAWNATGQVEATLATRGGQAVALVTPASGATRIVGLSPLAAAQSAPPEPPSLAIVSAPFSWYRFQGDNDSGVCASTNCGPTTVAMAIEFARNDLYVPVSEIRTYMTGSEPCGYGTDGTQLRTALDAWSVPYTRINGMSALRDAINLRGHIVIAPVIMADIVPGVDYEVWDSDPAHFYGRYYAYALGHWVVVRGISADGQWVQVYDPNVWYSGKYHYADGAPKGRDRLYRYSEFATALANNGNWAMEIMATPGSVPPTPTAVPTVAPTATAVPTPTLTPPPPSGAPLPPAGLQASQGLYTDHVTLGWTPPNGATFYTVHRTESSTGEKKLIGLPSSPSWQDADIAVGVTGYYWVTACNTNGCSDYAGPALGARASQPVLPAPASLEASAWSRVDDVGLTWSTVPGATHYEVRRSTRLDEPGEVLHTPASTSWGDASALPGQIYWYRAAACGATGCGALSPADQGVRAYPPLPARAWVPVMLPGR